MFVKTNASRLVINQLKKENAALKEENNALIAQLEEAKGDNDLAEKKRNLDKAKEVCDKTVAEYNRLIEDLKVAKKTYEEQMKNIKSVKEQYEKEMAEAVQAYKETTAH